MNDADRKLAELYREAHAADEPPPFAHSWRAVVAQTGSSTRGSTHGRSRRRVRLWVWAPAVLLVAVLSIAAGLRIRSAQRQRELVQDISLWAARDPLGFLLQTPGHELLRTVPTFDSKGEWQ